MRDKENTRQKLIEAAMKAFNENGYEGSTTSLIAKMAGVNELTLFRHFKNKKNLIMEMIRQYSPMKDIQSVAASGLGTDLKADLVQMGTAFVQQIGRQSKSVILGLSAALRIDELREAYLQMAEEQIKMLSAYFTKQMAQGKTRKIDPDAAAQMFNEMLFGFSLRMALKNDRKKNKKSIDETVARFVDIFINGISK